ncbi:MAG: sugar ABC transporter ATP-binding protein [Actinomycetota bacterium]|nr:sugar ABC transporter ATP-binding protein [Actinomycetota bacterium]
MTLDALARTPTSSVGDPVVAVRGVGKRFGATTALEGVSLDVRPGEVLGLIGTNGAGKSTLIKILSGVYAPSSGEVLVGGQPVGLAGPLEAQHAGIQTVHQSIDEGTVAGMTVAENLALDVLADPRSPALLSRRLLRREAARIAEAMGLAVDLDAVAESLPASTRQQVIIARALARDPRLLILDEPTSTLSAAEAQVLFAAVRRLVAAGVSVLYVSHRLEEIRTLCHRVAVLRDGRLAEVVERPFSSAQVVEAMLGVLVGEAEHEARPGTQAVLELRGVQAREGSKPFDLTLHRGEVVGLTGLVGAGKTELLEQLFGARPLVAGELRLGGRPYQPRHTHHAVRAGVALVPEERGVQAIVPQWSVTRNLTLPYLRRYQRLGLTSRPAERRAAATVIDELGVRCTGPEAPIESLSGGNQQKVVVARWLQGDCCVLLLDEPFRGIDVGARRDLSRLLRQRSRRMAVLVTSSDPQEILEVADRIVVMANNTLVGQLPADSATTDALAELMSGSSGP